MQSGIPWRLNYAKVAPDRFKVDYVRKVPNGISLLFRAVAPISFNLTSTANNGAANISATWLGVGFVILFDLQATLKL